MAGVGPGLRRDGHFGGCQTEKGATMTEIAALVHDVFGTAVDWRSAVTADGEALGARKGTTGVDWQQFADEWRGAYAPPTNRGRTGEFPRTHLHAFPPHRLRPPPTNFQLTALHHAP